MKKKFLRNVILSLTLSAGIFFAGNVDAATYQGELIVAPNVAVTSTSYGKLQGYVHKGIYNFKGVQYAQAERFMPPKKINSWSGTKSAITYGKICPQFTDEKNDIFPPHWYYPH